MKENFREYFRYVKYTAMIIGLALLVFLIMAVDVTSVIISVTYNVWWIVPCAALFDIITIPLFALWAHSL